MSLPLLYNLNDTEIPYWLRFPYLKTGYRWGGCYKSCCASLLKMHNETLNAWTMIASNCFSLLALLYVYNFVKPMGWAMIPFVTLGISAFIHLPFSLGYHLFLCISPETYNMWLKLDVSFIYISSVLLTFSLAYFVMPLYASLILTFVALCVSLKAIRKNRIEWAKGHTLDPRKQSRSIFIIVFIYCIPILYLAAYDTLTTQTFTSAHVVLLSVIMSLGFGAFAYADGFLNRLFPTTFDIYGSSHQIMHIGVGLAHIAEWYFVYDTYMRFGKSST